VDELVVASESQLHRDTECLDRHVLSSDPWGQGQLGRETSLICDYFSN
jgi:hypothetical protein